MKAVLNTEQVDTILLNYQTFQEGNIPFLFPDVGKDSNQCNMPVHPAS